MGMMGNLWIISMIGVNCLVIFVNTLQEFRQRQRLKSIKASNIKNAADLEKTLERMNRGDLRRQKLEEMMKNEGYVIDIYNLEATQS